MHTCCVVHYIIVWKLRTVQSNYNFTLSRVSTRGYTERAAVPHVMFLRVPRPRPTLSRVSHGHVQHCHTCPRVNSNVHGYTEELPWLRVLYSATLDAEGI